MDPFQTLAQLKRAAGLWVRVQKFKILPKEKKGIDLSGGIFSNFTPAKFRLP